MLGFLTTWIGSFQEFILLSGRAFANIFRRPHYYDDVVIQMDVIGFGSIPIVPIEVGNLKNQDEIAEVARSLKKFVTANDLVLVSSDFTHYGPRYHFQPFLGDPLNRIKKMDAVAYDCIARGDLNQFVQFEKRTHDTICGYYPCAVLIAMLPPDCSARLLNYEISSRIHKVPEGNMVSYLGIVISRKAGTASR